MCTLTRETYRGLLERCTLDCGSAESEQGVPLDSQSSRRRQQGCTSRPSKIRLLSLGFRFLRPGNVSKTILVITRRRSPLYAAKPSETKPAHCGSRRGNCCNRNCCCRRRGTQALGPRTPRKVLARQSKMVRAQGSPIHVCPGGKRRNIHGSPPHSPHISSSRPRMKQWEIGVPVRLQLWQANAWYFATAPKAARSIIIFRPVRPASQGRR